MKLASSNFCLSVTAGIRYDRWCGLFIVGRLIFNSSRDRISSGSWSSRQVWTGGVDGVLNGDCEDSVRARGCLIHLRSCSGAMFGAVFEAFYHLLERSHLHVGNINLIYSNFIKIIRSYKLLLRTGNKNLSSRSFSNVYLQTQNLRLSI